MFVIMVYAGCAGLDIFFLLPRICAPLCSEAVIGGLFFDAVVGGSKNTLLERSSSSIVSVLDCTDIVCNVLIAHASSCMYVAFSIAFAE